MMPMSFSDKVAVVTGGAQGIGAATVDVLAALGSHVAILDRAEEQGQALAARLRAEGKSVTSLPCDVAQKESVQRAIAEVAGCHGAIHVLICSAGIQRYGDALSTDDDVWQETWRVHVDGCFQTVRACLPHMIAAQGGSIVIVGSVQSVTAVANSIAYVTAKHALLGLTRSLALDHGRHGVRANCVLPGAVDTPMLRWSASLSPDPEAVLDGCRQSNVMARIGMPVEIANAVAFLASDWSSFITGAALVVDGGMLVPAGGMGFQARGTGAVSQRSGQE